MAELRKGLAQRRSVPNTTDVLVTERISPGTPQMIEPVGELQVTMARDGQRYGDPDLPRYATARADGHAPTLSTANDFTMRTKRAGAVAGTSSEKNRHKSAPGLVQPKRRSVW